MTTRVHKRVIKDIKDAVVNLKNTYGIEIAHEENNMYNVHFVMPGPDDTPFERGMYHGMIRLNANHPMVAPNIFMITPNGRFSVDQCPISSHNQGICTTATSYHPETWTPINNIETVIIGFISLMTDEINTGGIGSIITSDRKKKSLAKKSYEALKNDIYFKKLFPEAYARVIEMLKIQK